MGIQSIAPHIQIQTVRDNQCARTNSSVCAFPGVKLLFNHFQFHKLLVQSTPARRIHLSAGHKVSIAQFLPGEFAARHVNGKHFATTTTYKSASRKRPGNNPLSR